MIFYENYGKFGDRLIFKDDREQEITYSEAEQWAFKLREKGLLKARELAFCFCENSVGSGLGYLTFLHEKIVPLLLDRKIDQALMKNLLAIYHPTYLWFPADMKEQFGDYEALHEEYQYVLAQAKNPEPVELFEELALLLPTSGSTGSPKLVRKSYRNIQSNAKAIADFLKLDDTERPITTLPMNYTYGLSMINSHIQVGATTLFTDKTMLMKKFWDFFKENEATSFSGVPFTYELLKKVRFFRMDLPSLRFMTQSGGKLSPELHREFAQWARDNGKKYFARYGQTEATACMAFLPAEYSVEKCGSVGMAIPGGKFTLIDANGNEIEEAEQVGELYYEGENVTLGYAQCREDLAKGDERGGRLATGDMARRDADGCIYIVGRKKRFLKIFGNRVNLDEIDQLIKTNFQGLDCASTGVDDKMETFITDEACIDRVRQYLSNTTHLSESAFQVHYLETIPRNESGKVLYQTLLSQKKED